MAGGAIGSFLSIAGLGINQYNRWRDRQDTQRKEHDDNVAQAPDLAVKRLSEALDGLSEENKRQSIELARLRPFENDVARLQSMYQGSVEDRDKLIADNTALRQQLEDERTKWNKNRNQ